MLPNMRSVVAQCYYRGGRWMGPRRNFSSSIESKKDEHNSLETTITSGFGKWVFFGMFLNGFFDFKNTIPKWNKITEERKRVKQRHRELTLEALREISNKLAPKEKKFYCTAREQNSVIMCSSRASKLIYAPLGRRTAQFHRGFCSSADSKTSPTSHAMSENVKLVILTKNLEWCLFWLARFIPWIGNCYAPLRRSTTKSSSSSLAFVHFFYI